MQCKDLDTIQILNFINIHGGIGCTWFDLPDTPRSIINAVSNTVPPKLLLAKLKKLRKQGLIVGCCCGCRGDFHITSKGTEYIK